MDEKKTKKVINKFDMLLILGLLVLGALGFVIYKATLKPGYNIEIIVDGDVVHTMSLDTDATYEVVTDKGKNVVVVENHKAYVKDADCPDKLCENYKPIDSVGQSIICLPHKLIVQVVE